jgi:hypothetical protein
MDRVGEIDWPTDGRALMPLIGRRGQAMEAGW